MNVLGSYRSMTSNARRVLAAAALVTLTGTAQAMAGPVPYSDPAVTGSVGLCDRAGQPVTSGKVTDRPFVWRAVSSVKAPDGFTDSGRKATLLAYQPRPGVSADQWSGDQLTATSSYTNPDYPMSQATPLDFTLNEFLGEFKPMVDGLIQLRIYFGIAGRGTWNSSYPATDIQVTGDTWHVVRGASVPCMKGDSTSSEYDTLGPVGGATSAATKPGSAQGSKSPAASLSKKPSETSAASAAATGSSSSSSQAATNATASAAKQKSRSSGSVLGIVAVALVIAVGGATGGLIWWRRRVSQ